MPTILSGSIARSKLKEVLIEKVKVLREGQNLLTLAILQVGDKAESTAYIAAKKRFGAEIGVLVRHIHFQEDIDQKEVINEIKKLNLEKEITGIIIQLPLPKHLDNRAIIDTIDPKKDVDGITSSNVKKWSVINSVEVHKPWPATAYGIYQLLKFYKVSVQGKKVCVIGRSELVGAPIAALIKAMGGIVTVCHSKTPDLAKETRVADIIISAVGKAKLISAEHVHEGQIIIDVGLSRIDDSLVGDVNFKEVSAKLGGSGAISPVPGGVGLMTVLALFENLIDCATL
jgi:methylenetetrahydrofolate dehydrogenase (NADP+) / methenyltetrahydrofolate cyclohydrolase